ncbi:MAG: nitrite reductase [Thermoleophilia bacterium]|nr:nitrite reductase [Thermoleophilia bacterium]
MHQDTDTPRHSGTDASQHRHDFEILAPLCVLAVIAAVAAVWIAFIASSREEGSGTSKASAATPVAATQGAGGYGGGGAAAPTERVTDAKPDITLKRFNPATAPVKPGPKTFDLVTTEKVIKVGTTTYKMWTFNNTVPGPVMRVVQGDRVTIRIRNDKTSKFVHSIDHHASRLTLGGGHIQVQPGTAGEYTFTAEYPGVFMYHCATAPVLHHIGMGMYGMLIVQPKEGFGAPMPEYAITQSELYASTADIDANIPKEMAFNGIPSQYAAEPIKVKADANVRLFVLNAGPSEVSSFHVVGTVFDRVFADGNPRNATYGRQALAIPASGSGVFEMRMVGEGQFPFVTHQFNHASKGAVGMLLAGDGKPGPGAVKDAGANGHH